MDYTEIFGRIAFYSFLGVMLSIALQTYFESRQRRGLIPCPKQFWARFAFYTWVVVFACGISATGWVVFSIIDWIQGV